MLNCCYIQFVELLFLAICWTTILFNFLNYFLYFFLFVFLCSLHHSILLFCCSLPETLTRVLWVSKPWEFTSPTTTSEWTHLPTYCTILKNPWLPLGPWNIFAFVNCQLESTLLWRLLHTLATTRRTPSSSTKALLIEAYSGTASFEKLHIFVTKNVNICCRILLCLFNCKLFVFVVSIRCCKQSYFVLKYDAK